LADDDYASDLAHRLNDIDVAAACVLDKDVCRKQWDGWTVKARVTAAHAAAVEWMEKVSDAFESHKVGSSVSQIRKCASVQPW
jgi:hypothetical protein